MRIKGRKEFIPYALFEAFKARDERLELVPHYSYYLEFQKEIALCSNQLNTKLPNGMQSLSHFTSRSYGTIHKLTQILINQLQKSPLDIHIVIIVAVPD